MPERIGEPQIEEARPRDLDGAHGGMRARAAPASSSARARGGHASAGFASTIAALVERSPWAGSRGGSTATRADIEPGGSVPRRQLFERATNSRRKWVEKIHHVVGVAVEEAEMLVEREAVGHAGDIVGDDARGLGRSRARAARRHSVGRHAARR